MAGQNEVKGKSTWPTTSDKEFSKRMFKIFMAAFFVHILVTIVAETFFESYGSASGILIACIPVYSAVFLAVIAKGGVENVYKGKAQTAGTQASNG